MHITKQKILVLILGFSTAIYPSLASAQCPPNCGPVVTPLHFFYTYDLQITSVSPPPYVENQPITVGYRLIVGKAGLVGDLPLPREGSICGARRGDTCINIGQLTVGRTATGTVQSTALAGANSPIVIRLMSPHPCPPGGECFDTDELANQSASRPVAARYMVSIDGFTISRTRAVHEDSVKIDLMGTVDGQRSADSDACSVLGPPTYCVQHVPQGDRNDGTFPASGVVVGPYDVIPEVDSDLKFAYVTLNFGTSYNQVVAKKIFNFISDGTAAGLNAYSSSNGGSGGWDGANAFTHKINELEFGGCDGPVAVDAVSVLNKTIAGNNQSTLDALTRNTGRLTKTWPADGGVYEVESQDGCGKSSRYKITWSVTRTSWLPPV